MDPRSPALCGLSALFPLSRRVAHKVIDEMPPSGLLPCRVVSAGAAAMEKPLPLMGSWSRLLHGGRGGGQEKEGEEFPYADVPRPGRKWERKPYVTPMKVLIRRAKEERRARRENPCRVLEQPPENGLLVPHFVGVAHQVHGAWESLLRGLTRLVEGGDAAVPVRRCRFCPEVHVGGAGHEIRTCDGAGSAARNALHVWRPGTVRDVVGFPYCYHLFDRVGKPREATVDDLVRPNYVWHAPAGHDGDGNGDPLANELKRYYGKAPAVVELCVRAGAAVPAEYRSMMRLDVVPPARDEHDLVA
uniref:APO domain-containing protein n=1 Tax=Oryza brachyantha TaxID=4533 RepID=J3LDV8_ORYBR